MAKTLLPQLQQTGQVERSWLGVGITPVSPQAADTYRLPDTHGAFINNVEPGSPAAKAGLVRGEIIRQFDGKPIQQSSDLPWIVSNTGVGKTVTVQVVGPSGTRDVTVVLERMP
jgi:serine protease Do